MTRALELAHARLASLQTWSLHMPRAHCKWQSIPRAPGLHFPARAGVPIFLPRGHFLHTAAMVEKARREHPPPPPPLPFSSSSALPSSCLCCWLINMQCWPPSAWHSHFLLRQKGIVQDLPAHIVQPREVESLRVCVCLRVRVLSARLTSGCF